MIELTCIVCPKGCRLQVEDGMVAGAGCRRGVAYGLKEVTSPTRTLTSTVCVTGSVSPRLPVKTSSQIPKPLIKDAMRMLNGLVVCAPICCGEIVVKNICETGIDWIATKDLKREEKNDNRF